MGLPTDWLADRVILEQGYLPHEHYPAALVNITNRCNLSCAHCFVFRDANPNAPQRPHDEIGDDEFLALLAGLRDRHGVQFMLWMGGEPMLRKELIKKGIALFPTNHIVTNGSVPLEDFGPGVLYVISLDGPEAVNDGVRGAGSYARVMKTLARLPAGFTTPVQVQCVVTTRNQDHLEQLVRDLAGTRAGWITFSFYVGRQNDDSGLGWATLEDRMQAVREVERLKAAYPEFVRNKAKSLALMAPDKAPAVTAECLAKRLLLPLYLEGDKLRTPYCCYGNDVDCSTCGSWFVFDITARFS
jgi:MoaA/NifB/PqqE/SkfB family radical SAM enzyme